jgi:multiple sugar transport system substrate-binding protein
VKPAHAYLGLTWDHPRGYVALERAASLARDTGLNLTWKRQPLEGFESHSIEELARQYDLIVLDHPHLGDAVSADCLQPLESLFRADELAQWQHQSIGRTFESYRFAGQHWALPLDAAAQVSAARLDLLQQDMPRDWPGVLELARQEPVCLSLAGPHAVLTFFSLSAAYGDAPASREPGRLFTGDGAAQAWDVLSDLYGLSFKGWRDRNPIGILAAMSSEAAAVYCPLVFGYVNYAVASAGAHALDFADVPAGPGGCLGSTLGGTGLAISRRTESSDALRRHLAGLISPATQATFIPFQQGQPSARAAWTDSSVNSAWNGFFAHTQATLEHAIVRPRHAGYIPFQTAASALVRDALEQRQRADSLLRALQALYERHHTAGSEV